MIIIFLSEPIGCRDKRLPFFYHSTVSPRRLFSTNNCGSSEKEWLRLSLSSDCQDRSKSGQGCQHDSIHPQTKVLPSQLLPRGNPRAKAKMYIRGTGDCLFTHEGKQARCSHSCSPEFGTNDQLHIERMQRLCCQEDPFWIFVG